MATTPVDVSYRLLLICDLLWILMLLAQVRYPVLAQEGQGGKTRGDPCEDGDEGGHRRWYVKETTDSHE